MVDDLLVARNPEPGSSLPYLIRIPLGADGIVVKARETWPGASKVYCHRAEGWPADAEIVERHPVRSCSRRGPAIDLVLARARQNRSQLVLTRARGREMIFWQSPSTTRQARPAVPLPTARAGVRYPQRLPTPERSGNGRGSMACRSATGDGSRRTSSVSTWLTPTQPADDRGRWKLPNAGQNSG